MAIPLEDGRASVHMDDRRMNGTHSCALARADVSTGPCFLDEASLATNSTNTPEFICHYPVLITGRLPEIAL